MEIEIIRLSSFDQYQTVKDRIDFSTCKRLLLDIPVSSRFFLQPLDFVLIKRYLIKQGKTAAIVSKKAEIRKIAEACGYAAFATTKDASKSRWKRLHTSQFDRQPKALLKQQQEIWQKKKIVPIHPVVRWLFFSLAGLCLLLFLLMFLPSAEIRVKAQPEIQQVEIPIMASADVTLVNPGGSLPLREMVFNVFSEGTIETTGEAYQAIGLAAGTVQFSNISDQSFTIPEGTIVSASQNQQKFQTFEAVVIPAEFGSVVDVAVQAIEAGTAANVAAGAIDTVEGLLQMSLQASNPTQLTGGGELVTPIIAQLDYDTLRNQLIQDSETSARTAERLAALFSADDYPILETLERTETVVDTGFVNVGDAADVLHMTVNAQYRILYLGAIDLSQFAVASLDQMLAENWQSDGENPVLSIKDGIHADGLFSATLHVERNIMPIMDGAEIKALIIGKPVHQVKDLIKNHNSGFVVQQVKITPVFLKFLPFIDFRVKLILE